MTVANAGGPVGSVNVTSLCTITGAAMSPTPPGGAQAYVPSGGSTTVDISDIPQGRIRLTINVEFNSDNGNSDDRLLMIFNGDAANNYWSAINLGSNGPSQSFGTGSAQAGYCGDNGAHVCVARIEISNYANSSQDGKAYMVTGSAWSNNSPFMGGVTGGGWWKGPVSVGSPPYVAGPITQVTFSMSSGQPINANSTFSVLVE